MIVLLGVRQTLLALRAAVRKKGDEEAAKLRRLILKDLKEATPIDTGEARQGWRIEGKKIVNEVEHIEFLNNGSSQQAPAYFVEKTVMARPGVKVDGVIVTVNNK
jgi:hypothetical protein